MRAVQRRRARVSGGMMPRDSRARATPRWRTHLKANVVDGKLEIRDAAGFLVEKGGNAHGGSAPFVQRRDERVERAARVDDVFDDEDVRTTQRRRHGVQSSPIECDATSRHRCLALVRAGAREAHVGTHGEVRR